MISTSCQSLFVDLADELADERVGVEQVVGQEEFCFVADPLKEKRHRRMQGVALSEQQHPVKLGFFVAFQFQVDDLVLVQPRQFDMFGVFEDLRDRLDASGWLSTR